MSVKMPKPIGRFPPGQQTLLRSLAPHFARAKEDNNVDQFFEELFTLWFLHFPESEDDPDLLAWAIKCRKKVGPGFYQYAGT